MSEIWTWLLGNYVQLFATVLSVVGAAEAITRLTPTKDDDAFLERVGYYLRLVMDWLKIPNIKR